MRTTMAFAANLSFVLKSLPADGTGAARLREQRFRHSRFHDGASAERDHPLFQKVRLSEMVLTDALAA